MEKVPECTQTYPHDEHYASGDAELKEKFELRINITEFVNPIVQDALVIGKHSSIDALTFRRALGLLLRVTFEQLAIEDDVIGDVLVRTSLLHRIPRDVLIRQVLRLVKPRMEPTEVMHLTIETEISVRGRF